MPDFYTGMDENYLNEEIRSLNNSPTQQMCNQHQQGLPTRQNRMH
jgi:hypothetical protein